MGTEDYAGKSKGILLEWGRLPIRKSTHGKADPSLLEYALKKEALK